LVPFALVRASPALTRSRIISRSNSRRRRLKERLAGRRRGVDGLLL
jgi:hypothetical protein